MDASKAESLARGYIITQGAVVGAVIFARQFSPHFGDVVYNLVSALVSALILSLPYLLPYTAINKSSTSTHLAAMNIVALLVMAGFGTYKAASVILFSHDAQSGIELLVIIPVIQVLIYAFCLLIYNTKNFRFR